MFDIELDDLKDKLKRKKEELRQNKKKKQECLSKAAKVDDLYDRLKADKEVVEGYRKDLKEYKWTGFADFKGNIHNTEHIKGIKQIIESYDSVIDKIDINLDELNMLKAKYENKAYQYDPIIGDLESTVNTLAHKIENFFN